MENVGTSTVGKPSVSSTVPRITLQPLSDNTFSLGDAQTKSKRIHIIRHGQAVHNVRPRVTGYRELRDPPLTEQGLSEAAALALPFRPDLVLCSPMTRTIQTTLAIFPEILHGQDPLTLEIWPDLREAPDAICNEGVSRARLVDAFPGLDFSLCMEEWDYEAHSEAAATARAERVKAALWRREERDIVIVSHQVFISYMVAGAPKFANCETRSYFLELDMNSG